MRLGYYYHVYIFLFAFHFLPIHASHASSNPRVLPVGASRTIVHSSLNRASAQLSFMRRCADNHKLGGSPWLTTNNNKFKSLLFLSPDPSHGVSPVHGADET